MAPAHKKPCSHLSSIRTDEPKTLVGCGECLKMGSSWVHLRLCLTCGEVGCCNQSPNQHASKHAQHSGHPLVRSFEPGEDWVWCYADETYVDRRLVRATLDSLRHDPAGMDL